MSVALRMALQRDPDVALATLATTGTALVVALVAAAGEEPARGLSLASTWPFLLAGLLSPGAAQIFVTIAIRDSGSSRVSMIFGTAPLVSVTIALLFLGEPARAPLIAGAVLVVAGGVLLAREQDRPEHLNRLGLVFAFAGATLFAIRDNLVRHLAVGRTAVPPAVAAAAALLGGTVLIALWAGSNAGRAGVARREDRAPSALPGAGSNAGRAGVARPEDRAPSALPGAGSNAGRAGVARPHGGAPSPLPGARLWIGRRWLPFVPAGVLFGGSYVSLFEAYYRGRVTVVAPLVAIESLAGVALSALLLRHSELVGKRLIASAALIVAGGALIGAFR
jgi:drug/metabolite transporter (DMT)-like permease